VTAQAALKQPDLEQGPDAQPKRHLTQGRVKAVQKVAMSRRELERFVKDGRPTGVLISALAALKGLSAEVIAQKAKVTPSVAAAILADGAHAHIKPATIRAVCSVIGIDLAELRLIPGEVHVLNLSAGAGGRTPEGFHLNTRAAGLLLRGATIAKLDATNQPKKFGVLGREYHALQVDDVRAIVVGSKIPLLGRRFDAASVPGARWVCGTEIKSCVEVTSLELCTQLQELELNRVEFGQLFRGEDPVSWDDIRAMTREFNISRTELADLIRQSHAAPRRRARGGRNQPSLRLVDSEKGPAD